MSLRCHQEATPFQRARHTKQHRRGPVLEFTPAAFQDFLDAVKAGEFPVQL
ncbi:MULTISPECIES: DUF397 domain-containing protein [unclassified Kitasatospora]